MGLIEPPAKKGCCSCCSFKCCGITALCIVAFVLVAPHVLPYAPIPGYDPVGSSTSDSIAIYCERTVKDAAKYKEVFGAYAEYTQAQASGVRAIFSFMSTETDNKALQFFFFDGVEGFDSQPTDKPELSAALWDEYAGTPETDFCIVYGGWTEELKASATQLPGVRYEFEEKVGGFMRMPPAAAFEYESSPIILVSKRGLKPGVREDYKPVFQHVADMMYPCAPALVAVMEIKTGDDPDMTWSLRIFSNYKDGFFAHVYCNPLTAPTLALTALPLWGSPIFPVSNSFSTGPDMTAAIAGFPGNAVFTQYHFEDNIIGPVPDFSK